jgi:hypothetical protein
VATGLALDRDASRVLNNTPLARVIDIPPRIKRQERSIREAVHAPDSAR